MPFPGVTININDGNLLSSIQVPDAVPALFAPSGSDTSGETTLVYSVGDATEKGISGALLTLVEQFYNEVGGSTALYCVNTEGETMQDVVKPEGLLSQLSVRHPDVNLAAVYCSSAATTGNYINGDVMASVTVSKSTLGAMQAANRPMRVFLDGYIEDAATSGDTFSPNTLQNPFVAVVLGGTQDGHAAIGTALGRATKIAAHIKLGAGSLGPVSLTEVYFGSKSYSETGALEVERLHDLGFLTFMKRQGLGGYYFGVDNMCDDGDYRILVHGRVVDKAQRIAAATYMQQLEESVTIDDNGNIDAADAEYLSSLLDSQLRANMSGQFSNCKVVVPTQQDLVNRSRLKVSLSIIPLGYLTWITVNVGLTNKLE